MRWLVALAPVRDGREIGCIGLDEEPIVRNETQQRVVRPAVERDDAGKGDEPAGIECDTGQCVRAREAVHHPADALSPSVGDDRLGIGFRFARMHDRWAAKLPRESNLL